MEGNGIYIHPMFYPLWGIMTIHCAGWIFCVNGKMKYTQYLRNFVNIKFISAITLLGFQCTIYSLLMFNDPMFKFDIFDKNFVNSYYIAKFILRVFCQTFLADFFIYWLHYVKHHHQGPFYFRKTHKTHHKKFYSSLTSLDGLNSEITELLEFSSCMLLGSWLLNGTYLESAMCGLVYVIVAILQHDMNEIPYYNWIFNDGYTHWLHHKYIFCNYSTISPIWDKLFGTFIDPYTSENQQLEKVKILREQMIKK